MTAHTPSDLTILMMIDAYVPAAARERFRAAAAEAAPGARLLLPASRDEAVAQAADVDIATGWSLPPALLERGRRLKWVHAFNAGVDGFVGLPGIRDRRIVLTRTVGAHVALPDHVMALVLAFARRLHVDIRNQIEHKWDRPSGIGEDVAGKVLGIMGLGQIGKPLATRAAAFGMRVIGTKRTPEPVPHVDLVLPPDRIGDCLKEADYVVALLPLTPETRGRMGEREFRSMKPAAVFINVSRGPIVQEAALVRALREGWIAGAGLDVFEAEPLPADNPLYDFPQVIITPHVSGITPKFFERIATIFSRNLRRYVTGEPLANVIDVERGY
ncbi:MAG TPA: D-2-hydroxyacid dehydrogenase [bacterium]|nr:D-2-hydroxyacid dehydrogenase [bacterium]